MDTTQIIHQQAPARTDHALMRSVLLKHTGVSTLACVLLVLISIFIWYALAAKILAFGNSLDFAQFQVAGADTTALLQRYNPYFWWLLVGVITLILARLLYALLRSIILRTRLRAIRSQSFKDLAQQLSPAAIDVLLWAWQTRDEPLRVGDLQQARQELRYGRARKLVQAREQLAQLQQAMQQNPSQL